MGKILEGFEQEQAVLCAIMFAPEQLPEVSALLMPDDFGDLRHREIYTAMLELDVDGQRADQASLIERLDPEKYRETLQRIALDTQANPASFYAKAVRRHGIRRRLADECVQLARLAHEWHGEVEGLLDEAERRVLALRMDRGENGFKPVGAILRRTVERLEEMQGSGEENPINGLRTGLIDFDLLTGGVQPGQLIIIAARPKMGKTALALQIAGNVALTGGGVGMFSLEMTDLELGPRLLASAAKLNTEKFRSGRLTDNDWADLTSARARLQDKPLHIDDTMHTTVGEIRTKARRLALQLEKEKTPLRLIIVDYLQLAGEYGQHREQEIAAISRGLKALAKELALPVLALSQLNRSVEKRPDKRPIPSDLRDSGSLEQDADAVVFLYRDEVYHPNSGDRGKAELIISLQRGGPPGVAEVKFEEQFQRFSNMSAQLTLKQEPKREEPPPPTERYP